MALGVICVYAPRMTPRRIAAAIVAAFALIFATVAPANAVTVNYGDSYGPTGAQSTSYDFNSYVNARVGWGLNVCVTAKAAGGPMKLRVYSNTGTFSTVIGPFTTDQFYMLCAVVTNAWPGQIGSVKTTVQSAGGSGLWLRSISIN